MKWSWIIVFGALFAGGCQTAQEKPVTQPVKLSSCKENMVWADWVKRLAPDNPEVVQPLDKETRKKFLSGFNNYPPVSEHNPERVYTLTRDGRNVAVFFVDGKCVTFMNMYKMELVRSWVLGGV